jgi:hypothetical protein
MCDKAADLWCDPIQLTGCLSRVVPRPRYTARYLGTNSYGSELLCKSIESAYAVYTMVSTDTDGGGYEWYMYEVRTCTKFSSCLVVCYTKFSTKFNLLLTCYGPLHYIYLFLVMRTIAEF